MSFPLRPLAALSFPAFALLAGCAATTSDVADPTSEVEAIGEVASPLQSNCTHIPGCLEYLGASDGPFHASVITSQGDGGLERTLYIRYEEGPHRGFLPCQLFPRQPPLNLVFVLGSPGAQTSVTEPMRVECPTSYGDNLGLSNTAWLSLKQSDDPALWDTLFPPRADGSRWYAVQLAASNVWGVWDSRYGRNYRLVFTRPN